MTFDYQGLEHYRYLLNIERLVIGVSGGRSSAYQLAHAIEACNRWNGGVIPAGWIFVFENTSLEHWKTYEFLRKLDAYFMRGRLVILEWDGEAKHRFRVVTHDTLKREGEVFDAFLRTPLDRRDGTHGLRPLPNPVQRTCTANLKIKTMHRYVRRVLGWPMAYHAVIGYRADEKERHDKRWLRDELRGFDEGGMGVYPMYEAGVLEDRVLAFWGLLGGPPVPFDLELEGEFGNCDLCFMAGLWKIKARMALIAMEDQIVLSPGCAPPARVARWIAWEERLSDRPGNFRKDRPSYREIWQQVTVGDWSGGNLSDAAQRCGSCTD